MEFQFLKQRFVGALFLLGVATTVIPSVFDGNTSLSSEAAASAHPYQVALTQQLAHPQTVRENRGDVSFVKAAGSHVNAWSLRVGSFSDPSIAKQLMYKLQQAGYTTYLQPSHEGLYNVLVGPELAVGNAELVAKQLYEHLKLSSVVVPYEPMILVSNDVSQRG